MHRFYVPATRISEGHASLSIEQQKQVRRVLRMGPGDAIAVFDGSGIEFSGELEADDAGSLIARIVDAYRPETEPSTRLTIIQGIPKGEKLELILQKCTELGASEFLIASTERSVPKIPPDKAESRLERWRAVVREAAEQSGRVVLPLVDAVLPFREALDRVRGHSEILIAWEQEKGAELYSMLRRLRDVTDITLVIGPEGGFAPSEVDAAIEAGAVPISLGARILRAETAAIAGTAMLVYGLERQPA